ncbi:MAG: hypothetical protein ACOH16_06145 [Propionibacteriaceae bacterium]
MNQGAVQGLGRRAAMAALAALLVGGAAMSWASRGGPSSAAAAAAAGQLALVGPVALAAISLFDLFTVPALHQTLKSYGYALVLVATGCAGVGDLLGIAGRLSQAAAVVTALDGGTAFARALDTLERCLNIGGFALVAVSFSSFGLLFWRAGERALAIIAVATGILTGGGQVPGLEPLFYLANAGFLTWYVALVIRFRPSRAARPAVVRRDDASALIPDGTPRV